MWINQILYGPISGGMNHGIPAFHFIFSGEALVEGSHDDAEAIMKIKHYNRNKYPIALIDGKLPPFKDDNYLIGFTKALKDLGYINFVRTPGDCYRTWFLPSRPGFDGFIDCLSVRITDQPWVAFSTNEIYFYPSKGEIFEPTLPPENSNSRLFIDPSNHSKKEVYKFIKESTFNCGILSSHDLELEVVWEAKE